MLESDGSARPSSTSDWPPGTGLDGGIGDGGGFQLAGSVALLESALVSPSSTDTYHRRGQSTKTLQQASVPVVII